MSVLFEFGAPLFFVSSLTIIAHASEVKEIETRFSRPFYEFPMNQIVWRELPSIAIGNNVYDVNSLCCRET